MIIVNEERKKMVESTVEKYSVIAPNLFLREGYLEPIMLVIPNERAPQFIGIPMQDSAMRMGIYEKIRRDFPDAIASIIVTEAIVRDIPKEHPILKEFATTGAIPSHILSKFPKEESIRIQIERLYHDLIEVREWIVTRNSSDIPTLSQMETKFVPPDQHAMSLIIKRGRS